MKSPGPLMLAAGMLIWGWQTGHWLISIPMALLLEIPRFLSTRWDVSDNEFSLVADFCAIVIVGAIFYLFALQRSIYAIFAFIKWLPLAFFPLIMVQRISARGGVDIRSISLLLRRRATMRPLVVDLGYPYLFMAMLSASFANHRESGFYLAVLGLLLWTLWFVRPRRYSLVTWAIVFAVTAFAGYGIQGGLTRLQDYLETKSMEWFYQLGDRRIDPYRASTGIGYVGTLKLSSRLLFRVFPETASAPLLLAEAAYNHYKGNQWLGLRDDFRPVPFSGRNDAWILCAANTPGSSLTVSMPLEDGAGLLKLPAGAFRVTGMRVSDLSINPMGAVKATGGTAPLVYRIDSSPGVTRMAGPTETDLTVPRREAAAVRAAARKLNLTAMPPQKAIKTLERYFTEEFKYTLRLTTADFQTPLSGFLERTKAGHCEYFATATTLILRAAGIPARYTTGFSAHEWSDLEKCILVRFRHAHAWTLAFIDGAWRDVDLTPPDWRPVEDAAAAFWQPASDLWYWAVYRLGQWRRQLDLAALLKYLPWLALPVVLVFARRFKPEKKRRSAKTLRSPMQETDAASPLRDIERHLNRTLGIRRHPGQTHLQWLNRLKTGVPEKAALASLEKLIWLHYRLRFDPDGLPPEEFRAFQEDAAAWLDARKSRSEFT